MQYRAGAARRGAHLWHFAVAAERQLGALLVALSAIHHQELARAREREREAIIITSSCLYIAVAVATEEKHR